MSTEKRDPMDGDYVGNVFGWKISMIGVVVIGGLMLIAIARAYYLDVPMTYEDPDAPKTEQVDSLNDSSVKE